MRETSVAFRSKIDAWLLGVLVLAALPAFGVAVAALRAGEDWIHHLVVGVAVVVVLLWLVVPTRYTVAAGLLLLQCGPMRWRIPAREITRITPTRSLTSSPALSLDRLRIEYDGGRQAVLVSPVDQDAFIAAVRAAQQAA